MAVELAKVSLWLATAAAGKPLSFLDAHLRYGNALVGATVDDWESIPLVIRGAHNVGPDQGYGQETLFDLPGPDLRSVITTRQYLAMTPSDDRLQVRAKERDFTRLTAGDDFRRLRDLGDWWVTPFYSEDFRKDAATWRLARWNIEYGRPFEEPNMVALFEQTCRYIRDEIRPFHWEIEFSEVFFDEAGVRRGDAGFNAIIGNPHRRESLSRPGSSTAASTPPMPSSRPGQAGWNARRSSGTEMTWLWRGTKRITSLTE